MGSCASPPKVNNNPKTIIAYKKEETCSDKNSLNPQEVNFNHNTTSTSTYNKVKEISKSALSIKIEPDVEEYLLPIYLKKDEMAVIHVKGLWSFIPEYGLTDFKGHPETSHNNMRIGQVLYRLQGGAMHQLLNERSIIQAEVDGQLVLYSNNDQSFIKPQGSLDITLEGVSMLRYPQLCTIQEWNKYTKPVVVPDYLSSDEGEIVDLINRVRANPQKFAKQYIDIHNNSETKETYDFLLSYSSVPPLDISQSLSLTAKEHAEDIGRLGISGHITSINNTTIKQRLEHHCKKPFNYFGLNILYGKRMPWSIIVDMLIGFGQRSNSNRINLLNESFDKVGLSLAKHLSFKWVCVIVFGRDIAN